MWYIWDIGRKKFIEALNHWWVSVGGYIGGLECANGRKFNSKKVITHPRIKFI